MQLRKTLWVAFLLISTISTGCATDKHGNIKPFSIGGYTGRPLAHKGIKKIWIPMPTRGKNVFRRDLEQRLQENLVKHVQMNSAYNIARQANADARLDCKILNISQAVTNTNPDTGVPRERELTFVLKISLKDLRTGDTVFEDENFSVSTTYLTAAPYNEDFFRGSEDLMNRVARQVVERLQPGW